jgi:hypothetical protein
MLRYKNMGGGLMQLVAYGAQDIYLTGNPQITFFKVVYRRHTNFSMEAIEQTPSGSLAAGSKQTYTISRNGDLVHRMYIEATTASDDIHNPGSNMIDNIELEIGGQKIDKHYGYWMEIWAELTEPNPTGHTGTANDSAGTIFQNMSKMGGVNGHSSANKAYVPLQFWFCRNPGLALPLIALQYHEVKVLITWNAVVPGAAALYADYIYLDTDERRRFAQVSHEYLIEQVQQQSLTDTATNDINFNHPVKELIWSGDVVTSTGVRTTDITTAVRTWQLKLNGHDRFAARDAKYFTRTQIWQHHTGPGGIDSSVTAGAGKCDDSIAVYSFALKPEEHQPSGTCNFSRIDNAQLVCSSAPGGSGNLFAVNYNVLRIMSGMGGLAYSN